ncbi:MAG: NAD(P)-dependent oxidoreductase [Candidatus Omnitrophica bacterium]|nr:NAD(P)-dependent oxidoreductase [Candidatus Omnitrophota bacterium]
MIAFITGASGFIGSHLAEALLKQGFVVRALVRKTTNLRWLKGLPVELVFGDLRKGELPREALKGIDYAFHLAGAIQASSKEAYFQVNTEGTRRLLEALVQDKVSLRKFILVSSQAAGGPGIEGRAVCEDDPPHPVSFYGQSKLEAEKVVLHFSRQIPSVILRPPIIYGPRETKMFAAFRMMKYGFALAAGSQSKLVSLCYVSDLVDAILKAAFQATSSGRVYNVVGERSPEWTQFINAISKAFNRRYLLLRIPQPVLYLLGIFTRQRVREFIQSSWVIDGTRIREELKWHEKVSLEEGIKQTAEWYQKEGWL